MCQLNYLSFVLAADTIVYEIGTGSLSYKIPQLISDSDCVINVPIIDYNIEVKNSSINEEEV